MKHNAELRPYLYEFFYHQAVEQAKEQTSAPVMVSDARHMRGLVEARLAEQGLSMADSDRVSPVLEAIDETLEVNVPGYQRVYEGGKAGEGYMAANARFMDYIGSPHRDAQGNQVAPSVDQLGMRLPISPYDPRFSQRRTVLDQGSALVFMPINDQTDMIIEESAARVATSHAPDLKLYVERRDEFSHRDGATLREVGPAWTREDGAGLSALMGYMTEREYTEISQHVLDGVSDRQGRLDEGRTMSPEALERTIAIFEELRSQGTEYRVSPDKHLGQVKAQINGASLSVRVMDVRSEEQYVGRVYDNGANVYFSTSAKDPSTNNYIGYAPTPEEATVLLRVAQGLPVERPDGLGRMVGEIGTHTERLGGDRTSEVNDSYYGDAGANYAFKDLEGRNDGTKVMIRRDMRGRHANVRYFGSEQDGENYLRDAIELATENMTEALDVESLIEQAEGNAEAIEAGAYVPSFHADSNVAAIQRSYWDVLTGRREALLRPGATEREYLERVEEVGELAYGAVDRDALLRDISYVGAPADQVRAHAQDFVSDVIGSYDVHDVVNYVTNETNQKRFDPVMVARHMGGAHSTWRNNDEIIEALRVVGVEADELMGDAFYNATVQDRLVKFDESTARPMSELDSPFMKSMHQTLVDSISRNGARVLGEPMIDENGVITYEAERARNQRAGAKPTTIRGQIGQVFEPDELGAITTARFAVSNNAMLVPGYRARVAAQKPGENLSMEQRTRLEGYEQLMARTIEYQLVQDLSYNRTKTGTDEVEAGSPTTLNSTYRRMEATHHPANYLELSDQDKMERDLRETVLRTEARRVRYSNELSAGSSLMAEYQATSGRGNVDASNDNHDSPWVRTGGRNMGVLTTESDGFFDKDMTASGTSQGQVRFLVEGAVVNLDGSITPSTSDDKAPLMKHEVMRYADHNPADRRQMVQSNLMHARAVTEPIGVAAMTFGGWNYEDGMVVSERFASTYEIRRKDGTMRPLMVGDKISDAHGNKGVIGLIVNPDVDKEQAEAHGIGDAVAIFQENPNLDLVVSPFSVAGRLNAGQFREMSERTEPLRMPDGTVHEGGIGYARELILDKLADEKTIGYDENIVAAGGGRSASSQLAWALQSQGCDEVLDYCYGMNNTSLENLREMCITMGFDIGADGEVRIGHRAHSEADERRRFEPVDLMHKANGKLDLPGMREEFGKQVRDKGGFMDLPFQLQYPTARLLGDRTAEGAMLEQNSDGTYAFPIMSAHLRSGQELSDGTNSVHDYTNWYMTVFDASARYRDADSLLVDADLLNDVDKTRLEKVRTDSVKMAQSSFNKITNDLERRRFTGKNNIFKTGTMSSRLANSATAVISGDPTLDLDTIAVGEDLAKVLGVEDGGGVLTWRDPIIHDNGVRYMKVKIDDEKTGMGMNPLMVSQFEGDFDGDTFALVGLRGASEKEAREKLSIQANLLNKNTVVEIDGEQMMPLNFGEALDVKVSEHQNPELADEYKAIVKAANMVHRSKQAGEMGDTEALENYTEIYEQLNAFGKQAMTTQYGTAVLSYSDIDSHMRSVKENVIDTGAKGSAKSIANYARYLGATQDADGRWVDAGAPLATREDDASVWKAMEVKSATGIPGRMAQDQVKLMRNRDITSAMVNVSGVSQAFLQSKHDAEAALERFGAAMGPMRDFRKGYRMAETRSGDDVTWTPARDKKGNPLQDDPEHWAQAMTNFMSSPHGLNVTPNPEMIRREAHFMTDPETGMMADELRRSEMAAPMDRLAYGGGLGDLYTIAKNRENLFEGQWNSHFAPYRVRNNAAELRAEALAHQRNPESMFVANVEAISKADVVKDGKAKGSGRRSDQVRTAGRREPVEPVSAMFTGQEHDGQDEGPSMGL